jgi:imidazolonepropionase-like amidohydrolase
MMGIGIDSSFFCRYFNPAALKLFELERRFSEGKRFGEAGLPEGLVAALQPWIRQIIDGRSATLRRDVAIRIEDGRIVSVGAFAPDAAGPLTGTVIDRSQDTCLPGLIDAHAHVLIKTDDYQVDHLRRSSGYKALRGLNVVQEMLRSGWTTVRILGDADVAYAHFDVRTAIQEGLFSGPRLTGAGHYFSITGGGGDLEEQDGEARQHGAPGDVRSGAVFPEATAFGPKDEGEAAEHHADEAAEDGDDHAA